MTAESGDDHSDKTRNPRGLLHVIVHAGSNLPAADFALLKKATSDPYCRLSLDDTVHYTKVIPENLNPVWEETSTFMIGPHLPSLLLSLIGEMPEEDPAGDRHSHMLKIDVLDKDIFSSDDHLGNVSISLENMFQSPNKWHDTEVSLTPPQAEMQVGSLHLSLCWEPAPWLSPYLYRIAAISCFATAFALDTIAASCRWQQGSVADGALMQPGVAAILWLAAVTMALAVMMHFFVAHMVDAKPLGDLAVDHSAIASQRQVLSFMSMPGSKKDFKERKAGLEISAKAMGLTQYEIEASPVIDDTILQLPLVVLTWLLPVASEGLVFLAFPTQMLQAGTLTVKAGQIFAAASLIVTVLGLACARTAKRQPLLCKTKMKHGRMLRHHPKTQFFQQTEGPQGVSNPSSPRTRRRVGALKMLPCSRV